MAKFQSYITDSDVHHSGTPVADILSGEIDPAELLEDDNEVQMVADAIAVLHRFVHGAEEAGTIVRT